MKTSSTTQAFDNKAPALKNRLAKALRLAADGGLDIHIGRRRGLCLAVLLVGGLGLLATDQPQAAEKKPQYRRPPFQAFASQMPDELDRSRFEKPVWNLHDHLQLPDWLSLSVEQRTRYETMDNNFRANQVGGDQQIALQTAVWLQARMGAWRLSTELMDARAVDADEGSRVNNTHANTADILQGYLSWVDKDLFASGIGAEVRAGQQTINLGSRRLVARNVFRNTVNNFNGGLVRLLDKGHWQLQTFVTMPVRRLPTASAHILDDVHQFDEVDDHAVFSGAFLEVFGLPGRATGEVYLYHLDEGDHPDSPGRNRRLFTPGFRILKPAAVGDYDFAVETIGQFGTVRATAAAADHQDLTHKAWMQHVTAGYTLDVPWSPQLNLIYDYVSGDDDPNDNINGRFDTLYGARRWEFGPTGILGIVSRGNINSPAYRLFVAPRPDVQATLVHRAIWLASDTDSWVGADLRDRTGSLGNYVGQMLDFAVRWDVNSSLNLEAGYTRLFKGEFARNAPGAPGQDDINYFYVQNMLRF